jgi:hypothetical protein
MKSWKFILASFVAILVFGSTNIPVHAQQDIEFKNHRVETVFLENMRFTVEICGAPEDAAVIFNVRLSHENWLSIGAFIDDAESDSCMIGRYTYNLIDYPPFIPVEYYWQVRPKEGGILYDGPGQSAMYEDPRFTWDEIHSENITVYSHDRRIDFGQRVLDIAMEADQLQQEFYGLELKHPYRIVIYNTDEEFFTWNVNSSDYVAGESYPFFDLTLQIVENDSEDWLNDVIPHEISHLYFNQATYNPRPKSYPPTWLDEGAAVYNELSDHAFEDAVLGRAIEEDRIIPLYELAGSFGDDDDRVDLAYAEGYSAVSYMIEVYGRDQVKVLLNSYRRNETTDEAFNSAFQVSSIEFERNWKAWLQGKYSETQQITPTQDTPTQEQPVSVLDDAFVMTVLCLLGFAPFLFCMGIAGIAIISFMVKRAFQF